MSVCSTEEWLEMEVDSLKYRLSKAELSLKDYRNGDWWYFVRCIPAYQDMGSEFVEVNGKKGQSKYEVIVEATKQFKAKYSDNRPDNMMKVVCMCFKNGYSMELKELDPRYD
jgi:hypothetical protein